RQIFCWSIYRNRSGECSSFLLFANLMRLNINNFIVLHTRRVIRSVVHQRLIRLPLLVADPQWLAPIEAKERRFWIQLHAQHTLRNVLKFHFLYVYDGLLLATHVLDITDAKTLLDFIKWNGADTAVHPPRFAFTRRLAMLHRSAVPIRDLLILAMLHCSARDVGALHGVACGGASTAAVALALNFRITCGYRTTVRNRMRTTNTVCL